MENEVFGQYSDYRISILACFVLSVTYVSSLYIWNSPLPRDHPASIRQRFISVFFMMLISPLFVHFCADRRVWKDSTIWRMMGFRTDGLKPATLLPLILTMILFLGPLAMQELKQLSDSAFWKMSFRNLTWWRSYVVAPLSEELTFRACMMPLLLQSLSPLKAVFICPLFFGVAHFHHIHERIKSGYDVRTAVLVSVFQFTYTTIFGAYSAFLFVRTGHFAAVLVSHVFCNCIGFPDFGTLVAYKGPKKTCIMTLFVVGLILWCMLLYPVTDPEWYANDFFWVKLTK